jgi:hypothetical protein
MPANTAGSSTRASTRKSAAGEDAAGVDQPPPPSNSKNKGKGKAKSKKSSAPKVVTSEKVEAERTSLLSEKQTELAAVLDRHDDLVGLSSFRISLLSVSALPNFNVLLRPF